jgi:hypothetical protein
MAPGPAVDALSTGVILPIPVTYYLVFDFPNGSGRKEYNKESIIKAV